MSDSDSDDDLGPKPVAVNADVEESLDGPVKKKAKVQRAPPKFEGLYLEQLPSAEYYEHSYMHRDLVTHICVSKESEFIVTGSADGHVKFWKKMLKNIEFVKHYQAHLGPLHDMVVSFDGNQLATTSSDKMVKIFEIAGFDMSNMIEVHYVPKRAAFLSNSRNVTDRIAITDQNSGKIYIYKTDSAGEAVGEVGLHSHPVCALALNAPQRCVVSTDSKGIIEYWDLETFQLPAGVQFQFKTETSLYELMRARTHAGQLAVSPQGGHFATYSRDKKIRLFKFLTGKLLRLYDESAEVYKDSEFYEPKELERRMGIERDIEASPSLLDQINILFDQSGSFLLFSSLRGVKVVSIATNKVVRVIGGGEGAERFLSLSLYQGVPQVDQQLLLARQGSSVTADELQRELGLADPTLFATALHRRRFFCLSSRPPDETSETRDKFNELPTEEDQQSAVESKASALPSQAILHTNFGDIVLRLFGGEAPLAVENFATHCKNGYYDNVIFHRVIKGFMIQTGDPLGDGTGGESIWGKTFPDEFSRSLRHDRPYTLSMANAGPETNGSQFFVTTAPCPWLDNKHTVFGRVVQGFEVVNRIEGVKTNKHDRPYDVIKIVSTEVMDEVQ